MTNSNHMTPEEPRLGKARGRAWNGALSIAGAAWLATLAFGRLIDAAETAASPTREQFMLAFFYIAAAAMIAILRGFISIGTVAGSGRTVVLLIGLPVAGICLLILAAILQPATPEPLFWIALSLPVLGSLIEDRFARGSARRDPGH